jgi:hypothetical protein
MGENYILILALTSEGKNHIGTETGDASLCGMIKDMTIATAGFDRHVDVFSNAPTGTTMDDYICLRCARVYQMSQKHASKTWRATSQ